MGSTIHEKWLYKNSCTKSNLRTKLEIFHIERPADDLLKSKSTYSVFFHVVVGIEVRNNHFTKFRSKMLFCVIQVYMSMFFFTSLTQHINIDNVQFVFLLFGFFWFSMISFGFCCFSLSFVRFLVFWYLFGPRKPL